MTLLGNTQAYSPSYVVTLYYFTLTRSLLTSRITHLLFRRVMLNVVIVRSRIVVCSAGLVIVMFLVGHTTRSAVAIFVHRCWVFPSTFLLSLHVIYLSFDNPCIHVSSGLYYRFLAFSITSLAIFDPSSNRLSNK